MTRSRTFLLVEDSPDDAELTIRAFEKSRLVNEVVLVRDDNRTVLTMANDFKGDPKEFAVVIPVPTVLQRGQIHQRLQGADVEVLAVTDRDHAAAGAVQAAPSRHPSRRGQILAAYRRLGVPEVRRHRLHLQSGAVSDAAPDLIAAFSELVGHDCYPGMWCLAPWRRDGDAEYPAGQLDRKTVQASSNR